MKRVTLLVSFFFFSSSSVFADGYLDSLYREYRTAKVDTHRYNIVIAILDHLLFVGSPGYNPDSTNKWIENTIAIVKKDPVRLAIILSYKATYLQKKGLYESANACIDSSIKLIEPFHQYDALGGYYYRKATINEDLKLQQRCVESVYKAIVCYEKAKNDISLAQAFFYLAGLYRNNQQHSKAEEFYLKAAEIYSQQDTASMGICYLFCARLALSQKDFKKAKQYLEKAHPVLSSKVVYQPFYYYFAYGQWLKATGQKEEALEYFKIAAVQCIKGNQRYQKPATLCEMAEIYIEQKKFGEARRMLDEAAIIANQEQNDNAKLALHITLSKYYEAVNQPAKAFIEYKMAQALKDSANQNQLSQSLTGSALEFDYNKKEMAQAEQQRIKDEAEAQKLRTQKLIAYATGIGLVFVGFISFLLYRNNREQKKANKVIAAEKQRSEDLLLNILPEEVAEELKAKGSADAKLFDDVTVLFTDFKSFTKVSERLTPQQLVDELNVCFSAFDAIMTKHNIEKIKTVGDAYLAVSGLPLPTATHATDVVNAAIDIREFIKQRKAEKGDDTFDIRIGVHSGSVVAGIVGVKKFAYDIWGDTVNTAARMEQNSEPGKINISEATYKLVKDKFTCQYRGEIDAKNKGKLKMYFVS